MALTGRAVLLLAVLLSVASVAGTVWLWPRLAARSWPALFGRLGTIVVTQLALVCTLLLAVNDSFLFYSSWSDLFGRAGGPVSVTRQGGGPTPAGSGGGPSSPAASAAVHVLGTAEAAGIGGDATRYGRVDQVRIPGATTGLSTDGYVYLPPQYFQPAFQHTRFPAVVVMTGFPGDARNLITKLEYPAIELRQLQAGAMRPLVQILMRPSPSMPRDSECEDIPNGPQARTYFTTDVPQAVEATYRVASGGRSWGAAGDSTGGYCALKLAMANPGAYTAAVSLSGYFKAAEDFTTGDLFGGSQQRRNEADLGWRLAHLPQPPVSVLLASSKQDGDAFAQAQKFAAAVHSPMTADQENVDTGGHNFTTWVRLLPTALSWLSDHLAPPA